MKLRIKVIEDGLVNNPEKMLGLNNLSTRIELLEQLIINEGENHQRDYDQLKELTQARERELQTQINILYMLVVGLLLTIVGIGLAPIVSKKKKKKKKKKQQLPTTQPSPPHQSAG